jgi:hypothetical protein
VPSATDWLSCVEPHNRGGIDHSNCSVQVFLRQKLRFSARGVGNERHLVLHDATAVAKAELRRAECIKSLGVRRRLCCALGLHVPCDCVFVTRRCAGCSDSQEERANNGQVTRINKDG